MVLPAPLGPITAVIVVILRRERDVVDGDQTAETHRQMLDGEKGMMVGHRAPSPSVRSLPRDRNRTVGSRWASKPAGTPQHDSHHARAETQHAVLLHLAERLRQSDDQEGRDHHADLAAHAAEHDDRQDHRRLHEGEALGD